MLHKPFGAKAHGAIDYVFVAILLGGPRLLNLTTTARRISYGFGAAAGILNGLTNQPYALRRVIPFRVHGQVDTPFVAVLLLPWLAGALKEPNDRGFFLSFFGLALTSYLLTDFDAAP